jgi:hypothetical protein
LGLGQSLSISLHYLAQGEGRQGGSVPSPCLKHIPVLLSSGYAILFSYKPKKLILQMDFLVYF